MRTLKNFNEHNRYVGLPDAANSDIDIGRYEESTIRLKSDPVRIDFYRISFKRNFVSEVFADDSRPPAAIFFYSPKHPLDWDLDSQLQGYYIQLSKQLISKHRYLFQNYMEYGQHEALYLTESEEQEIDDIFRSLMRRYKTEPENTPVLISYAHVLITLIESCYQRQFSTDTTTYNRIVSDFQQMLRDYYKEDVESLPTVQYFADRLHLTSNYLGDIIKRHTDRTAMQSIHDLVIRKAKELLRQGGSNMSQIAYTLGFEYPNNFSKFFKVHTDLTPSEFRKRQADEAA